MNKIAITITALVVSAGAMFAQPTGNPARITAYNALISYKASKDIADLKKAKEASDRNMQNDEMKGQAKTWFYRGNIYLELYKYDLKQEMDKLTDISDAQKKLSTGWSKVQLANLAEATTSFLTCHGLDKEKKIYVDNSSDGLFGWKNGLFDCNFALQNIGVQHFNQKDFAGGIPAFDKAIELQPAITSKADTSLYVNAGNCALNAKDYPKAAQLYEKLTELKYGKGATYNTLASIYREMKDDAKAKATIDKGLAMYPQDAELLVGVVNDLIAQKKMSEAVDKLNTIIAARPNDAGLRLVVGQVYALLANPQDAEGKLLDKPSNFDDLTAKAEEQLNKANELKPNDFDINYELGRLFYNQGYYYFNQSNEAIKDAAKFGTLWEPALRKGMVFLEKALEINPKDRNTMQMLKVTYGRVGENDKYNQIKEKLKGS